MIVLGLTGSIGMGKSVLAAQMESLGIPVHCADAAVHALLSPDGAAFPAVAALFPDAVTDGTIDRKTLGRIVFADTEKRAQLESILHPLVRADADAFVLACHRLNVRICALDIPLLFETGGQDRVHHIVCATAPSFVQRRRVLARAGMTAQRFDHIKSLQMPDAEKRRLSDTVINTARGRSATMGALKRLKQNLLMT